jgi:hypothetical protein
MLQDISRRNVSTFMTVPHVKKLWSQQIWIAAANYSDTSKTIKRTMLLEDYTCLLSVSSSIFCTWRTAS